MAARRRRATATTSRGVVVVNTPAPLARRSSGGRRRSRAAPRKRRRASSGGGHGGGLEKQLQNTALGGLAYGLLKKNWPSIPRLPGIGTSGTVALAVYFLKPKSQLLRDMGIAAAAIAGYSFGETGTVSGHGDEVLSDD